jgi:3D (Asp-Asp-Asp) domain-containing protein
MPTFAIALMGFIAFSGGPMALPEQAPTTLAPAEADLKALAIADEARIVRNEDAESFTVKLTAYNALPEQTDANPFVTASGAASNAEVVAARSVDLAGVLPFGTIVEVTREGSDTEGCRFGAVEHLIGYRVIADSMHSRKRDQVDILLNHEDTVSVHGKETNPAVALGLCSGVTVRPIGKMKISDIPETQEELRRIVEGDSFALR